MKDFLGRDLIPGDRVVHGVGGRYGGLDGPYYVHSLTPKMVRIARKAGPDAPIWSRVPSTNLVKIYDPEEHVGP